MNTQQEEEQESDDKFATRQRDHTTSSFDSAIFRKAADPAQTVNIEILWATT